VTRRLVAGILILLFLHGASPAQPTVVRVQQGIRWVASFERAKITAELSDAPLIVYAYLPQHAACQNFEEEILAHRTFRKLSALFVMVRLNGEQQRDLAETFEVKRYPALIYLDSSGKKLYLLDSKLTGRRVLHTMARTFLVSMYNGAERAREAGEVRRAVRGFQTLLVIARGTPPANWAQDKLKRIAADGVKKLSQAQIALDAKDHLKAMTLLDELAWEYRGTQAGADAQKLMNELSGDAEAARALAEVDRRRRARRRLERATRLEKRQDLEEALITYWDVLRDYPDTPATEQAAARANELAKDRQLALKAARTRMKRDCRLWMEMARAFEQNKRTDKALEYYQRVITYYKDTSYAEKAQEAINNLLGVVPRE